jgi:hypothetical protein
VGRGTDGVRGRARNEQGWGQQKSRQAAEEEGMRSSNSSANEVWMALPTKPQHTTSALFSSIPLLSMHLTPLPGCQPSTPLKAVCKHTLRDAG